MLLAVCGAGACDGGAAAPAPQALTFWSGIAPNFTRDLIARFNHSVPHTEIRLQTTSGGVVVVSAVDQGKGELGLAQSDVVYLAYRRGIERELYPHTNLRGMAVLWVNNIYVVVRRDSGFHNVKDLRGKRVGVIMPGTSGEFSTRIVLGAYGMSYSDVKPTFQGSDKLVALLARNELDAAFVAYPLMPPGVLQVNATVPLRLIPITREVTNQLRSEYPFLKRVVVAADQLPGQRGEVETVGADWLLVCRNHLPEELVYQLTKEFFAHLPDLAARHAEAALIDPEQAATAPIPLHPGAARYYREREILK
jgi:TRAP transporter TAXI family solute receptor